MNKEQLILVGGGGHCKSCIDVIEAESKYQIYGILDKAELIGTKILNYEIVGSDNQSQEYIKSGFFFLITVGQIKSADLRKRLFTNLEGLNAKIATIASPLAYVSRHSIIAKGTIIMHGAKVNAGAEIGENAILNTGSNIEHDSVIGRHCHISTHAVINGDCVIGDDVFVGSNATVSNQITLGNQIVIAAGTVINKDILDPGIYAGNPAKRIG